MEGGKGCVWAEADEDPQKIVCKDWTHAFFLEANFKYNVYLEEGSAKSSSHHYQLKPA